VKCDLGHRGWGFSCHEDSTQICMGRHTSDENSNMYG
jgi:hypothetical protein